jgi:adenine-specific DNA-methyltransferase
MGTDVAESREFRPVFTEATPGDLARRHCAGIAPESRLAFAQRFTFTIVEAWWRALGPRWMLRELPGASDLIGLTMEDANTASRIGEGLAAKEPRQAAGLIGAIYAACLPDTYRAAHGIYYTPPALADRLLLMAENAGVAWRTASVLDPACGSAALLLPVVSRMVDALAGTDPASILQQLGLRLRGIDIDPFGAWLAQVALDFALLNLTHAAGQPAPRMIESRDSLDRRLADLERFDLVIGNPPYGRISLPPARRALFQRSVYGHANLYGLFTDAALRWVRVGGVVAYVTPTSMLSGLYYRALRTLLAAEAPPLEVNFVGERNNVFADVLQETMLATYRRGGRAIPGRVGFLDTGTTGQVRLQRGDTFTLPADPSSPWLLPRSSDQLSLSRRLRLMPHRLRDYAYGVSTGPLVWNRFKPQLATLRTDDAYPVIWAESVTSDGRFVWRSEKRNHAPWFVARRPKDDWLILDRPCVLVQRTTAKEQKRRLIAAELPDEFIRPHVAVVVENHLNMVRPVSPAATLPAAVIAALLNSAAVDAAFRCINGSVAVSAFELEELPLPAPSVLNALARLISCGGPSHKVEALIAAAYGRADAAAAA